MKQITGATWWRCLKQSYPFPIERQRSSNISVPNVCSVKTLIQLEFFSPKAFHIWFLIGKSISETGFSSELSSAAGDGTASASQSLAGEVTLPKMQKPAGSIDPCPNPASFKIFVRIFLFALFPDGGTFGCPVNVCMETFIANDLFRCTSGGGDPPRVGSPGPQQKMTDIAPAANELSPVRPHHCLSSARFFFIVFADGLYRSPSPPIHNGYPYPSSFIVAPLPTIYNSEEEDT